MSKSKTAVVILFFLTASIMSLAFLVPTGSDKQEAAEYLSQGLILNALHYLDFTGWAADILAALVLLTLGWFVGGYVRPKAGLYKLWGALLTLVWVGVFYFLIDYTPNPHGFEFEAPWFWGMLTALCLLAYLTALHQGLAERFASFAARGSAVFAVAGLLAFLPPAITSAKKFSLHSSAEKRFANAPNVLLISIDTLRADHLSCYGYHKKLSPYIDAFAKGSSVFLNAIATSPWTLPSHVTILTGHLPSAVGVYTEENKLPSGLTTLAELLRENGYYTMSANGGGYIHPHYGFAQGFNIYGGIYRNIETEIELINSRAMQYIFDNKDKKFFFFYHTYQTHCPYYYHEDFSEPDAKRCTSGCKYQDGKCFCIAPPMIECHVAYEGEIGYMDYHIGQLFEFLKQQGLYDNTLIIFTSDHGETFVDDQRGITKHGFFLYDELLKVPLIIKLPHQALGGKVIDTQVSSLDIVPTILDVLGVDHRGYPGRSLLPVIRGEDGEPDKAIAEYYKRPISHHQEINTDKLALRRPDSKLIAHTKENFMELYDLVHDPKERASLLDNPSLDAYSLAAEMLLDLTAELQKSPPASAASAEHSPAITPELKEQLEALGYVK